MNLVRGLLLFRPKASCSKNNPLGVIEKYEFVNDSNKKIFKEFLEEEINNKKGEK
jgi:hypothetical protein